MRRITTFYLPAGAPSKRIESEELCSSEHLLYKIALSKRILLIEWAALSQRIGLCYRPALQIIQFNSV